MGKVFKSRLGSYVGVGRGEGSYRAFLPLPLPPDPGIDYSSLHGIFSQAVELVGLLDGASKSLPDMDLFLYYCVRKEAVLSSQVEGTQSTLEDLLMHEEREHPPVPIDDVEEVSSYVAALRHGLKSMSGPLPLSLRLIREMHGILLNTGRGSNKLPGEFRTSQNWIGGSNLSDAVFVPPPPERLMEFLDSFEKYMHMDKPIYASLIDAAMLHVQFETIHPFLDGNGRIGRLLIVLFLVHRGVLSEPILYLSLYFKNNRREYYDRLDGVRISGDWEGWLGFFLAGVAETARSALDTSRAITDLFESDLGRLSGLKRARHSVEEAHNVMCHRAVINVRGMAEALSATDDTARSALKHLRSLGIIEDVRGRGKGRVYIYRSLLNLLEADIDKNAD